MQTQKKNKETLKTSIKIFYLIKLLESNIFPNCKTLDSQVKFLPFWKWIKRVYIFIRDLYILQNLRAIFRDIADNFPTRFFLVKFKIAVLYILYIHRHYMEKFRRLHCIRSISFESIELYKGKYIVEIIWIQMLGETQRFLFWLSSKIIIDIYMINWILSELFLIHYPTHTLYACSFFTQSLIRSSSESIASRKKILFQGIG